MEVEKTQVLASAKAQFSRELAETTHRLKEEHTHQIEILRQDQAQAQSSGKEEFEREKERAVEEAVRQARMKWLQEKET